MVNTQPIHINTAPQHKEANTEQPFFSPSMMKENQRVTEKLEASMEAGFAMQKTLLNMLSGQHVPWWVTSRQAMQPCHLRSSANSRRLSR